MTPADAESLIRAITTFIWCILGAWVILSALSTDNRDK